jgi:two-component system sensor histidine kinase UhpB
MKAAQPPLSAAACGACPLGNTEAVLRRVNAALEEQARSLGQALHDESGQALTAALISLAAAYDLAPPAVQSHLDRVKQHLEQLENQLQRLASELRPRMLDDFGLVAALELMIESTSANDRLTITFAPRLLGPIAAPIETAVYRFAQESITNILRHSRATRAVVELQELHGALRCSIRDNGVGFDVLRRSHAGLGLAGMRKRLRALGGVLMIDSAPGHGTSLMATIPMEERQ